MKNKGFIPGLVCGILLVGCTTTTLAASGVLAERSNQPIYVDGKQVAMTAYTIGGNNYVKLRDIGRAVDFGVTYDAATNRVQIDSGAPYAEQAQNTSATNADGSINIPQSDAKLNLKVGDLIRCDDGSNYAITDMRRYDKNAFASGPLEALPTATCDWSKFPTVALPTAEARRFKNLGSKDYLFIRNLYETRRMQYTLYNAIGSNKQTWQSGNLVLRKDGTPLAQVELSIPDDTNAQSFWPWRATEITNDFNSCPPGIYQVEAWDVFANGIFQYTEYKINVK